MGKTNFSMQLTDTEKEIMDFVAEVVFSGYDFSKAGMVSFLVKEAAINYVGLDDADFISGKISDEFLLSMLKARKRDKDMTMINFMGVRQFRIFIEECKKNPSMDAVYFEELLEEYITKHPEANVELGADIEKDKAIKDLMKRGSKK